MAQGVIYGHDALLVQESWHHGFHTGFLSGLHIFAEEPCFSCSNYAGYGFGSVCGLRANGATDLFIALDICVAAAAAYADPARDNRVWGVDRLLVSGGADNFLFLAQRCATRQYRLGKVSWGGFP